MEICPLVEKLKMGPLTGTQQPNVALHKNVQYLQEESDL
jgi:hypothetical protein